MPFRTLRDVSVRDVNDEGRLHHAGTVLSDWEISDFVKSKIHEGSLHYRSIFEPLTDEEALAQRSRDTALEGDHMVDGQAISPPWADYVGLHPEEIILRMHRATDKSEVTQVKLYEKGGQARVSILDYVAPVERPPFHGYDDLSVREVLEKMEVLSGEAVQETIAYELAHRRRPAIVTYERSTEDEKETETREEATA